VEKPKRGRPPNTVDSEKCTVQLNEVARDYLKTIAKLGTKGNNWTDVAALFIGEGIERAIEEKLVPRRELDVTYPVAKDQAQTDHK
jgi:hypothetical protein